MCQLTSTNIKDKNLSSMCQYVLFNEKLIQEGMSNDFFVLHPISLTLVKSHVNVTFFGGSIKYIDHFTNL